MSYLLPSVFYITTYAYTSSLSKPFYLEAPEPFPCLILQGNNVGEWGQASEPWLLNGHPLSVVHPEFPPNSQARSVTRLPLPPGALSYSVLPDSVGQLFV
jgi:hypothetical protein